VWVRAPGRPRDPDGRNTRGSRGLETRYRKRQLICENAFTGIQRYPNVVEEYPAFDTGVTLVGQRSSPHFSCPGIQNSDGPYGGGAWIAVSKGKTHTHGGGINIGGVLGGVEVSFSANASESASNRTTITYEGNGQGFWLCGSNGHPTMATHVMEVLDPTPPPPPSTTSTTRATTTSTTRPTTTTTRPSDGGK
jgi:hypothetical protein